MHYSFKHEEDQNASYNNFYPIICQQSETRRSLRLGNDGKEHHVEGHLEDNEVPATMQDMTDCFKLGKTLNQYKQLCSNISPASCTSSHYERDYSDFGQYDGESRNDETEITKVNFENQHPDFRVNHSVAHESFRTKIKEKPIPRKPISFS